MCYNNAFFIIGESELTGDKRVAIKIEGVYLGCIEMKEGIFDEDVDVVVCSGCYSMKHGFRSPFW